MHSLNFLGFYIIKQKPQHSESVSVRLKQKANLLSGISPVLKLFLYQVTGKDCRNL